ncbi:hypothetical protein [Neobacillus mesonae]|uniref:hypothetical protein n=1 Tax=Neobacillus mesonae TaxID=1193713 RepID=UPI00203AEBA0|nr:hypothetical protein [Neobacillus mesonae]MCM3570137.1 hypothetical protein [Neobacillus mesonae]
MMNLKSGNIERFEEFSQFGSLTEFNHHLEMWLSVHKKDFSKGELIGLKRLVRFAAKIPGICNAKIGTILKAIHQEYHNNGISRSTFKRMIGKAKNLGIFTVYETERKNGSQSSNLYVFNRFPDNEPPKQMSQPKETGYLFKTTNQKIIKRNQEPSELDHTFVNNRVPQTFILEVKYFFPEAKLIEEYWHMAQIAAFKFELQHETDMVVDYALQSFKQLIRKLKFTNTIRKPIAYYYGILMEKLYQFFSMKQCETQKENTSISDKTNVILYDWLHDEEESVLYDWLN